MATKDYSDAARELLCGAYDLHVHTSPDHDQRSLNDWELLTEAEALGMAGVLIKNHYEPTTGRARLVQTLYPGKTEIYGSIALNWSVGGLNPYAVESAARMGAKMVWLPTREAVSSMEKAGIGNYRDRPALRVVDGDMRPLPSLLEVLEVARDYKIPVSTGHILREESFVACRAGLALGVTMVLSHPEYDHTPISVAAQKQFAEMGVLIEKDWVDIALKMATVSEVAQSIREVGAEHIYLATDRGQKNGERPAESMRLFVTGLLENGISEEEIIRMIRENPRRVLGK